MKKTLFFIFCTCIWMQTNAQSVGIGTNNPNKNAILDLGPAGKPMVLPRMTSDEMNAAVGEANGMIIYNSTEHQLYAYNRYRNASVLLQPTSRWQPISTGPQMVAWGIVDSLGGETNGSGNYAAVWDANNHWYTLTVTTHNFYKDSMMLIVTPVGNGSWDQTVAIGEVVESNARRATIKFTDVSRTAASWPEFEARRRSNFYFVLYNLRKDPYNFFAP